MEIMKFPHGSLCLCLMIFLIFGCVKHEKNTALKRDKNGKASSELVESEMMLKVGECLVCHGTKEAQRGPILDGMEYWYLFEQLQKFHNGTRGQNPDNRSEYLMGIGVRKIDNAVEMAYLANWFADRPPQPAIRTIRGDISAGKKIYEKRCLNCHGIEAEGKREMQSPSLSRLEGWYFYEQMRKFRNNSRGYHPRDLAGQTMAVASKELSDGDIRDVVAYVVENFGPVEATSQRDKYLPTRSAKPF